MSTLVKVLIWALQNWKTVWSLISHIKDQFDDTKEGSSKKVSVQLSKTVDQKTGKAKPSCVFCK